MATTGDPSLCRICNKPLAYCRCPATGVPFPSDEARWETQDLFIVEIVASRGTFIARDGNGGTYILSSRDCYPGAVFRPCWRKIES